MKGFDSSSCLVLCIIKKALHLTALMMDVRTSIVFALIRVITQKRRSKWLLQSSSVEIHLLQFCCLPQQAPLNSVTASLRKGSKNFNDKSY